MVGKAVPYETFHITITGSDDNPTSSYYHGVWEVVTRASPKAASVALAHLKAALPIHRKESQIYVVRTPDGRLCQNLCVTDDEGDRTTNFRRLTFEHNLSEPFVPKTPVRPTAKPQRPTRKPPRRF